ncbi:hypothetical protein GY45DRAFT_1212320, partial [Cubamyces sp. BRFM 1775]
IRGGAPANRQGELRDVTYLDVVVPPPTPLRVGQTVTISALRDRYTTPRAQLQATRHLIANPLELEGRIVGVRSLERKMIELIVSNNHATSTTAYAYLAAPLALGTTVDLGPWGNLAVRALRPFLAETREVRLE